MLNIWCFTTQDNQTGKFTITNQVNDELLCITVGCEVTE